MCKSNIDSPEQHVLILEQLINHLKPGSKVLDIGCGSGYISACFAKAVGETGKVFAIDHI